MSFSKKSEVFQMDKPEDIHRHPLTGISVLVVGAGPVGLYTALECWRKGHNVVKVIERAPGPSAAGSSAVSLSLARVCLDVLTRR